MAVASILTKAKVQTMAIHSRAVRPCAGYSFNLRPAKAGSPPESVSFVFYDADGKPISDPCPAEYNSMTGHVTLGTPTVDNLYYCVITDDAGNMYSIAFGDESGQTL